jgi:hypothetical protein
MKSLKVQLALGIFVAIIASLPYLYGELTPKPGMSFLARSVFNSADTYVYVSNIHSAKDGYFLLPNLYSTESQQPFLLRPIYLILGWIARIGNLDPLLAYHLGRFVLTILFSFMALKLIKIYFKKPWQQLLAYFVLMFSSGFGFFVHKSLPTSIDILVPESNTFFSLLESPHFIMIQIGLVSAVYFLHQYFEKQKLVLLIYSSVTISIALLDYPYLLPFVLIFFPLVLAITGTDSLEHKTISLVSFILPPLIVAGIIYFISYSSPIAQLWFKRNSLPSPSIFAVLSGYGLLALLAGVVAIYHFNKRYLPLILWIGTAIILSYVPFFSFQRRLLTGLHIPFALLATVPLIKITEEAKSPLTRFLVLLVVGGALVATTIFNMKVMIGAYNHDTMQSYTHAHHIDLDELSGMKWLEKNTKPYDIILAHPFFGNIIPAVSGRFVYLGHRIQTIDYDAKFAEYTAQNPQTFKKFLKATNIAYVFVSKYDVYKPWLIPFSNEPFLRVVWERDGAFILKAF